jgi:predicted kinase
MKIILVRGLPGSGKSTYARRIAGLSGLIHVEADMFFEARGGFDPARLPEAHRWCQATTARCLAAGHSVVVANTFTQRWELAPYWAMAQDYGATVEEVVMRGAWGSIHNVPAATIAAMRARWED